MADRRPSNPISHTTFHISHGFIRNTNNRYTRDRIAIQSSNIAAIKRTRDRIANQSSNIAAIKPLSNGLAHNPAHNCSACYGRSRYSFSGCSCT
jgi:hypothetical protein